MKTNSRPRLPAERRSSTKVDFARFGKAALLQPRFDIRSDVHFGPIKPKCVFLAFSRVLLFRSSSSNRLSLARPAPPHFLP